MQNLILVLVSGLAAGAVSVTVAQSKIFRSVREWVGERWEFGGALITCPYCLGHWVSYGVLAWQGVWLEPVTWAATVGISALTSGLIDKVYRNGGDHLRS